ncbi:helix-turn-helix transcriptional regulator [Actinosynnema sp. NPDC023587]|uniref:helix-turn-helix domain-containing protein n=1 Tax=Actinosynnema sp. NPDC023587 TaxID=3154695 RepID=UPI0033DADC96
MAVRRTGLAKVRKAAGYTQESFAEAAHVDRATIARWEAGERSPRPYKRPMLARLLKIDMAKLDELLTVADVEPAPSPTKTSGVLLPVVVGGQRVVIPLAAKTVANSELGTLLDGQRPEDDDPITQTGSLSEVVSTVNRRSLLARGIAIAALPNLGLDELQRVASAMEDPRRYLDGPVIDYFRRQLVLCKTDDGSLGPAAVLPVVLGILGAIETHAREVTPDVRRSLLLVGADAAEFAGWLYRDSHDAATAGFWHDRAIEWAQEAGDMPMQGYVLLKKSQMAYEERDGLRVLTLAQAAQYGPWQLPPKVRAEVTQQEARGLAMLGEPFSAVQQKLDDARRLADVADTGDERHAHLGMYYNEGAHMLRVASCYVEAGKPAQAAALFADVLDTQALSRRDEGYFRARRASALALSGEPDDAAQEGLTAMRLVAELGSIRTKRELARVLETLTPWANRSGPRALREAVRS